MLPEEITEFMAWSWPQIEPYYRRLEESPLSQEVLESWLANWSALADRISETEARLYVATTLDTTDTAAEARFDRFLDEIFPAAEAADQRLKEKFLASGLALPGFEIPLRNMRAEARIFREENLPLITEEQKQGNKYDRIIGVQTVNWQGEERTIPQMEPIYQAADRGEREHIWRLAYQRRLADRDQINQSWTTFMDLRERIAANAGFPDYRAYCWAFLQRFDYSPQDCLDFHQAIEKAVVPAATRVYEKRSQRLGASPLRPWDLDLETAVYPFSVPPLQPFKDSSDLIPLSASVFRQLDPQLGTYFDIMNREGLLDLDNRKGKAPGGYTINFDLARRPFIFMNAVGTHDNVQTLLHEAGHAFHVFEESHLPYHQQREVGAEFGEVASMAMELLAQPYLQRSNGGLYSREEAARALLEHLESSLLFWPYMAVVDAFQHWVYANPQAGRDPQHCDDQWAELWERFIPAADWSGLEAFLETGWHRKLHIHEYPFYYVEYGLAQLGAVQVWRNALKDQAGALRRYRQALSLGGTRPLPELYQAAGVRLAFDSQTLGEAVDLMEQRIEELETLVLR